MQTTGIGRKATVATIGLVLGLAVGVLWLTGQQDSEEAGPGFWDYLSFGGNTVEVEYYSSLEDAVDQADLVVKGTVSAVRFGRIWGDADEVESQVSSVHMDITVSEVLQGDLPADARVVTVERQVFAYLPEDLKAMVRDDGLAVEGQLAAVPGAEALFVLRARSDAGSERVAAEQPAASGVTYRLVNSQGLITENDDGTAGLPLSRHPHKHESPDEKVPEEEFADSVLGQSFSDVVSKARGSTTESRPTNG